MGWLGLVAMPLAQAQPRAGEVARPPVRIRTLLLMALVVMAVAWAFPRARAAWQLQLSARALADYGLCMVGPTGPSLLRDNPDQFRRLVRRRLVASAANERPFYECADQARKLTDSVRVERAHLANAWSFVEYGGPAADRARRAPGTGLSLRDLSVTTRRLAELTEQAWPFIRGGYTRLVRPSRSANEAVYAVEPAVPALGRGLPAWRARYRAVRRVGNEYVLAVGSAANLSILQSADRGVTWRRAPDQRTIARAFAERCPAEKSRAYTFGLSDDDRHATVTSFGPDAPPYTVNLAPSNLTVFAAACDQRALVAALRRDDARNVTFKLCPFRQRCRDLPVPNFAGVNAPPRYPLDLARVGGTTVLAVSMHGVVRVASTRDDGGNWTPYAVAFDRAEYPALQTDVAMPDRLLTVGPRLVLCAGAAQPTQTYPVLVSDNAGASWRAP